MTDQSAEISALQQQARDALARVRAQVMSGDFNLKPEVEVALVQDSAAERGKLQAGELADPLDKLLRDKGLNRKTRRTYISNLKRKDAETPAHTRRAQDIANRKALERVGS